MPVCSCTATLQRVERPVKPVHSSLFKIFSASGRPGSNRRPSPWQGDALPTELLPQSETTWIRTRNQHRIRVLHDRRATVPWPLAQESHLDQPPLWGRACRTAGSPRRASGRYAAQQEACLPVTPTSEWLPSESNRDLPFFRRAHLPPLPKSHDVPPEGFEPPTYRLGRACSSIELWRHGDGGPTCNGLSASNGGTTASLAPSLVPLAGFEPA